MPKISQLPIESAPTTTDYIPMLDQESTTTKRTLLSSLVSLFYNNTPSADAAVTGWRLTNPSNATLPAPNTITYNGNNNYSLVFNSVDFTGYISSGMKLRGTRTVTAPTRCTSLNGTTQYYSKASPAGMTWTDDFNAGAWIKPNSYKEQMIISRYNGTSGWALYLETDGRVTLKGWSGGPANNSYVTSYRAVPLNKWTPVAAQLDMSAFTATTTTSYIMIDGLDVLASVGRGGTNPTALIQAGNLEVGSYNGGLGDFWSGKLCQVFVSSAKIAQATIQTFISQGMAGTETSIASAYSFNSSITDLNTTNANNLTANGSAVATNVDSPFAGGANASTAYTAGTTEFAEVFGVTFSTNSTVVVQVPDGHAIPTSGGLSALAYSMQGSPLGWPGPATVVGIALNQTGFSTASATAVQFPGLSVTIYVPTGRRVRLKTHSYSIQNSTGGGGSALSIWDGTVGSGTQLEEGDSATAGASAPSSMGAPEITTWVTPGTHTFNIGANRGGGGGTATFNANTAAPAYLSVEPV